MVAAACGVEPSADSGDGESGADSSSGPDAELPASSTSSGGQMPEDPDPDSGSTSDGTGPFGESSGDSTTEGPAVCGDGVVDSGEECDTAGASDTCTADCTLVPGALLWDVQIDDARAHALALDDELLRVAGVQGGAPTVFVAQTSDGSIEQTIVLEPQEAGAARDIVVDGEGRIFVCGGPEPFGLGYTWHLDADGGTVWAEPFQPGGTLIPPVPSSLELADDYVTIIGGPLGAGFERRDFDGLTIASEDLPVPNTLVAATTLTNGYVVAAGATMTLDLTVTIAPDGSATAPSLAFGLNLGGTRALVADGETVHGVGFDDGEGWLVTLDPAPSLPVMLPINPRAMAIDETGALDILGSTPGASDLVVLEITPDGSVQWSASFPVDGDTIIPGDIAIDAQDRIYISGTATEPEPMTTRIIALAG